MHDLAFDACLENPAAGCLPITPASDKSPADYGTDVVLLAVQVRRRDIAFLCHLVGSYEGLGIVRTLDAAHGMVELMIAPAFYDTALALLHDLAQDEIPLRILEQPGPHLG